MSTSGWPSRPSLIGCAVLQGSPSRIVVLRRSYSEPSPFRIIVLRPPAAVRRGEKGEERSPSKPRAQMFWLLEVFKRVFYWLGSVLSWHDQKGSSQCRSGAAVHVRRLRQ
jgi:hypothetical protein